MATGNRLPHVLCRMCEKPLDVAAETMKAVDDLADNFCIHCPHCRAQSLYKKADIIRPTNES